jgi:hypothetical protein
LRRRAYTEGVREQGAEEHIWTEERLGERRMEKTAKRRV